MSLLTKTLVIGSDHAGFAMKKALAAHAKSLGLEVEDVGCHDEGRVDYPDFGKAVCDKVVDGTHKLGVVVCGSGIGISIAANKVNGIRCALCHDHYTASMCRKHNDANVLAVGGRTTGEEIAKDMLEVFLTTEFEGGRHADRVAKISALEH